MGLQVMFLRPCSGLGFMLCNECYIQQSNVCYITHPDQGWSSRYFAALWSGCAVDWNLNTCPFLGQVVNLDLLLVHRIWSTTCWFVAMPCFYSRTNQCCFGQKQVVAEICFQLTLSVVINQNLQSIKTLLTLELSQYNKSGSTFPGCGQQTLLLT